MQMNYWTTTEERLPDVNWIKILTTENITVPNEDIKTFRDVNLRMFIKNNDEGILLDDEWNGAGFYDYTGDTWYKLDNVMAWMCVESPYTDDLYDEDGKRKVIE